MRVAVLGRTRWLLETARAVAAAGHKIVIIGTSRSAPEYGVTEKDLEVFAREINSEFFCDPQINRQERVEALKAVNADVAISINWVNLIGEEVLRIFRHGVINAHTGDLPRYKGNAAPNWALLEGESSISVTLHQMSTNLDAGPVFLKRSLSVNDQTYISDVYEFLTSNLPSMFVEVLEGLERGTLKAIPQPTSTDEALHCYPRQPQDGCIDWSQSARDIHRMVRSTAEPFAGAYTYLEDQRLVVWRSRVETMPYAWLGVPGQVAERRIETGEVVVLTGDETLVLEVVEGAGAGRVPATEVIKSVRQRLGMHVPSILETLTRRIGDLEQRCRSLQRRERTDES